MINRLRATTATLLTLAIVTSSVGTAVSDDRAAPIEPRAPIVKPPIRGLADFRMLFRTKEVLRTPVMSSEGKQLGNLEDLVIDATNGVIRYAALEFDALFGRTKLFAVPWNALRFDLGPRGLVLVFDITQDQLKKSPGFPRDRWPEVANRKWAERIDIYYGVIIKRGDLKTRFGTKIQPLSKVAHLVRSSKMTGFPVRHTTGRLLGTTGELVIELNESRAAYAVIETKSETGKIKMLPVPVSALTFVPAKGEKHKPHFVYRPKSVLLGRPPTMQKTDWSKLRDPAWARRVDHYYGVHWEWPKLPVRKDQPKR